ncbi:MAG TPA: cysteine--tRNA ligase [Candidatus Limnocylindrales bacterium]|nr:cysteine--tRNA ligase [Candidatus Limnocylindrales bacterium]
MGPEREIKLYDSATRTVRPFVPLVPGQVEVYDCGPTVWSTQHIGNLYRYIVADVVRRTFEHAGYEVRQVMNVTDVGAILGDVDEGEDRMAIAARREGRDPLEIAETYTRRFMADRRRLNILDPHVMPKATEHVPEMIALIQRLIEKGHAYVAPDGVYFDISTFPGYGTRLNRELPEDRLAGARIEVNPHKRHPADFALWRGVKEGDLQVWDSPWGRGKPGWHIECSAMSMKYLGETFDIHSGGEDHLFPHHECEIAQSEAATGDPFVRYWIHVYFLRVEGGGMHKSLGNMYLLSDLESWGFDPLAFRLLVLGVSYRKGLDFTRRGLEDAQRRLERWRSTVAAAVQSGTVADAPPTADDPIRVAFVEAIADDFNTPAALAQAEEALTLVNTDDPRRGLALLFDMDRVLGLGLAAWTAGATALSPEERDLLDAREAARQGRDFARSDALRVELERRGIRVRDTKEGARWERIAPAARASETADRS